MVYLEFVVGGVPISNQSASPNLQAWRTAVAKEAQSRWKQPILLGKLKGIIINFHLGDKPSLDVDNLSKPIFDVMEGIVYENDRQITQAEITHVRIDAPFVVTGGVQDHRFSRAGGEPVRVRADRGSRGPIPTSEVMP